MQDQGKRLLIAVALALGVLFAWQWIFPPKKPDQATNPQGSAAVTQPAPPASKVGFDETPGATAGSAAPAAPEAAPRGPEQTITLTFPAFTATFSSYGGALTSWKLTDKRYAHDKTSHGGELVPSQPGAGELAVGFTRDSTFKLPSHAEWKGTKISDTEVRYTLSTPALDVEKTFTIVPDAYLVKLAIKVTDKGGPAHQTLAVMSYGFQDPKDKGGGSSTGVQARVWESSTRRNGTLVSTPIDSLMKSARYEANIQWTGFEHPYLLVGFAPKPGGAPVEKHTYAIQPPGLMQTDILFTPQVLKAGQAQTYELVGYLGPKNLHALQHADDAAGFSTGFHDVIDLGWFAFLGRPLLWLLQQFYAFLGNWGLAIVLLTILVKALTVPLITKSMRSMKAMAVLGPQMKALQEKYKGDKQRLQIETMALYKQYGVNPLAGCLPILLQMPVWLALYRMLSSAGELYQQPFISGWIDDLTHADPTHVLPIVLVVTMFAQARLTPQTTDPSQKLQQRMMQYGMPLMFGVMSFWFPAGLTLYIFTNTVLSALHSIYMNKFDKKSLEFAAQLKKSQEAAQSVAAKTAKDANARPAKEPARTEEPDEGEDEGEDEAEGATSAAAKPNQRAMPARPRRKKGRRR